MVAFYSHCSELHSGLILSLTVSHLGQKLVLNEENVYNGGHKLKQENVGGVYRQICEYTHKKHCEYIVLEKKNLAKLCLTGLT